MGEATTPAEEAEFPKEVKGSPNRKKILIWVGLGFFIVALLIFIYWFFILRFEQYTDDAYVSGNLVELTSQVPGIVTSINVDNTDYVKEGQVLIELDKTDYILAFEESKNRLGETVRDVVKLFLKVEELEAALQAKEAKLLCAEQDYENRVGLVEIGAVSEEEFEHVGAALKTARASAKKTYHSLQAAYAQVQGTTIETHPMVMRLSKQVKDSWVNLQRCDILSPVTGYIAQRTAQLGEWVELSEPLLAVVPLDELWVDANYKETQLAKVRIGQDVKVRSDLYGRSATFKGKIVGINPGTGSVFSALPPQNATGNWIKIVQRVPVRVSLDPKQLEKYPLWLGLSMETTIDIHDTSGDILSDITRGKPLYQTKIYQEQEEGVEAIIRVIIEKNMGNYGRGS